MNAQTKEAAGGGAETKAWQADLSVSIHVAEDTCVVTGPSFLEVSVKRKPRHWRASYQQGGSSRRQRKCAVRSACGVLTTAGAAPSGPGALMQRLEVEGSRWLIAFVSQSHGACWVAKRMHHCFQITVVITDKRGGSAQPSHTSVQPFLQIICMCPSPMHAPTHRARQ